MQQSSVDFYFLLLVHRSAFAFRFDHLFCNIFSEQKIRPYRAGAVSTLAQERADSPHFLFRVLLKPEGAWFWLMRALSTNF